MTELTEVSKVRWNYRWPWLGLVLVLMLAAPASAQQKPNVLFIVADDLGWNDVGWHGAPLIKTPNLDKLVREGVELDQHYVQPVCTPTRVALLSGRYPSRFGPHALVPQNVRCLPSGTETLASALQSVGYETYMAGKWHLGSRMEWGPKHYGFDHSYGTLAGAVDPWTHQYRKGPYAKTWHRDCEPVDETSKGNVTELVARQIVDWIGEKKDPWFIYVPFHAVHIPVDTPPEYKKLYADQKFYDDPAKDDSARRFAAFVTQLDTKVGEFIRKLEETGQRENTLVVFTSDNGGLWKGGNAYVSEVPPTPVLSSNEPLRGQKGQVMEGGIRVSAFANWPGKLTPRKVSSPMHAVDWFPTIGKLVGYKPKQDLKHDGRDIWPLLTGEITKPEERTIYIPYTRVDALRHGDWKLIVRASGDNDLFNLAEDPYETKDLIDQEPARRDELLAKLKVLKEDDIVEVPADVKDLPNF